MAKRETVPMIDFAVSNGEDFATYPEGDSMTRQEFAEECDINNIMKGYNVQDIGALMRQGMEANYVDFSKMPTTLMDFMDLQFQAEEAFMTLPADVRKQFDNDPMQFVEYGANPENVEQMRKWGLAEPAKTPDAGASPSPTPTPAPPPAAPEPPKAP